MTAALVAAWIASLALAACTGDGGGGEATATGTSTASPTATETATPDATATGDASPTAVSGAFRADLETVASGLTAPVYVTAVPDGSGRLFVVEQTGAIRVVTAGGELLPEPFLDVTGRMVELRDDYDERGLLGLAFHPRYAENGRFFVYYSAPLAEDAPGDWDHTSHLSEFSVTDDADVADPESERLVLAVDQPQSNHNGGHITFGPDGYLYVPLGDGGGGNDVGAGHTEETGNAQDRSNLLGTVLRIDVEDADGDQRYAVPEDNPFVGEEGVRPEIWAYGLRNPYDIGFDSGGEYGLLIADAGQELFEEVSVAFGGENFGWNIKEGTHCFDPADPETAPDECEQEDADGGDLVGPVVEYHRDEMGAVVTGARIYRGGALPDMQGMMVFVDWMPGNSIYVATPNGHFHATGVDQDLWEFTPLELGEPLEDHITGIGEGPDGELYVLTNAESAPVEGAGSVYRIVPPRAAAVR